MHNDIPQQNKTPGSLQSYLFGFILSILLTVSAYMIVFNHLFTHQRAITAIIALGFVQVVVQMLTFLNLPSQNKTHWNRFAFIFMLLVIIILVTGSLWIMHNLDYRMMDTH